MTPDELRALADALPEGVHWSDPITPEMLAEAIKRFCADAQPVAEVNDRYSRDGYNDEISVLLPVGTKLYTHPAPAAPQAEPFVPHARCKTPDKCRRDGVCFDAWACSSGPAPQAEPIDPHMIVAEDRFPDVPAERWKPCPQCGEDVDRECPICDGLGRVLATDGEQAEPSSALIRAYNSGYMQGHHDTVESCFTDIHQSDMDTYHADVVAELGLTAAPQAEPMSADRCRSSETPDPKATGPASPERPASNREDAAATVAAGSGAQAEPKREPLHELPPLPEPGAYAYEWRLQTGSVYRSFSARHYNGVPCDDQVLFFTADQMREYARRAVDIALERAAQECHAQKGGLSSEWGDGHDTGCDDCFAAIRALGKQHD